MHTGMHNTTSVFLKHALFLKLFATTCKGRGGCQPASQAGKHRQSGTVSNEIMARKMTTKMAIELCKQPVWQSVQLYDHPTTI